MNSLKSKSQTIPAGTMGTDKAIEISQSLFVRARHTCPEEEALKQRLGGCLTFICRMEPNNPQLVTPVKKSATKIVILRKKPDKIEIRRRLSPCGRKWVTDRFVDIGEDQLLVVRVLKWDDEKMFPLGTVTKVITQEDYLDEVLHIEMGLTRRCPSFQWEDKDHEEKHEVREDFTSKRLPNICTFTIDSKRAQDLDDAISVIDNGETYTIAVHITDVASYVRKDSDEDKFARQQGRTFYSHGGDKDSTAFMLDRNLSSDHLSLLENEERKAISLITIINKDTNMIENCYFTLSFIKSHKRLSYEKADEYIQERLDSKGPPCFSDIKDCVTVAYRFTEEHRRWRLQRCWCSGHSLETSDLEHNTGSRSHCMVAELMHLYNSTAAEELISSEVTSELTPLRCHPAPDPDQFNLFKSKYSALLPFSPSLSHICETEHSELSERIRAIDVLGPVFEKMEEWTENRNHHGLIHLLTLDKIHPTLRPMANEFREIQSKAEILRSCSTLASKAGHYGLQLNAYTWASSPMRRYIDLVLQRLLHSVLLKKQTLIENEITRPIKINPQAVYTESEIDEFCKSGMERLDCALDYDLVEQTVIKSSSTDMTKLVVVDQLPPKSQSFSVSALLDKAAGVPVMYRNLKVVDQPEYSEDRNSVNLQWKRRVYSFSNTYMPQPRSNLNRNVVSVSAENWRAIIRAVTGKDWDRVRTCLQDVRRAADRNSKILSREEQSSSLDHFKTCTAELNLGKVLQVQLGTEVANGTEEPTVNLLTLSPSFEVCLEHARNPTRCFSKYAYQASKTKYRHYREYQKIWGDLCQMDTAYNAVEENNSVILEDVSITWQKNRSQGFFKMTETQKKEWLLEFDLTSCFLCIRLRNQPRETEAEQHSDSILPDLQSSLPFTWVAHGVPIKPKTKGKDKGNGSRIITVHFEIKHQNMQDVPIFDSESKFTVEVIPKKIPCLQREEAIANIVKANDLVKSIATGQPYPHLGKQEQFNASEVVNRDLKLRPLNASQKRAVEEALQNPFTVIQGPPGTGKTVVGVQITSFFHMKNKESEDCQKKPKEPVTGASGNKKEPKKVGILYCGPSNKAVDIVAEQLLEQKDVLRPLRIHCDQLEMREFPYYGSNLKLCRQTLRDERIKDNLRDISLMDRVRGNDNPNSAKIRELEALTTGFDYEEYREVLKKAQKYELKRHDIILCTCSTALKPILKETMDFRQIIIDECAMATEPEAFIPLVAHNPQQIVLLGDHKQVRPIVSCALAKELGMERSLFERYMEKALMLDTQYRMHKSICEFPSKEFYEGKLKTGTKERPCLLLNQRNEPTAILFGHVEGTEVSLVVSTTTGNENSVENEQEAEQAVRVAGLLIKDASVKPEDIAILTPYNAQMSRIKEILKERKNKLKGIENISVCTIMKSQGSEWPYVIISTVRSCELAGIRKCALKEKLGFVTNPNQVNVAITRAQDGLCILGNRHLLKCSDLWNRLLTHYQQQNCVFNSANDIKVVKQSKMLYTIYN